MTKIFSSVCNKVHRERIIKYLRTMEHSLVEEKLLRPRNKEMVVRRIIYLPFVMLNFMFQLDWATGLPDICSIIILGVYEDGFLMKLKFKLADRAKQIALPNVSGP